MDNRKIHIIGGGTVSHVRSHLALCAPAYGSTARKLTELCREIIPNMDTVLHLTRMADPSAETHLETNNDVAARVMNLVQKPSTRVIFMSAALCDYDATVDDLAGKYAGRLQTAVDKNPIMQLIPAIKVINQIRKDRKDVFLVGFKTTCGMTASQQYIEGLQLCKRASCNLVLANDVETRMNMVITPEESRYKETQDRDAALRELVEMTFHRTHMNFTRSTVVAGSPISWYSDWIPKSLRTVINYCISQNAYRPLNGVTAGHFACKIDDNTFLTSIRKTDFNKLSENGLVKIVTDGPDKVIAYGAKPSVGGQSQRIVFKDHPDVDCIVHFHCPLKSHSKVPSVSQREFECGSIQCGENTSKGLSKFGNLYAVYLDNHGPNIVFNRSVDPREVIEFIENNFDLTKKTGGYVSED